MSERVTERGRKGERETERERERERASRLAHEEALHLVRVEGD